MTSYQVSIKVAGCSICYFKTSQQLPYFLALKMHQPIRRTVILLLQILEKNNNECILILVIYWKKTGL